MENSNCLPRREFGKLVRMRPASADWKTLLILAATLLRAGLCLAQAVDAGKGVATAGWAEVEITPPLGIALGGRGGAETLASRVIDPLYAQVLYLKDGKGISFVLASFDLLGLPHRSEEHTSELQSLRHLVCR